MTKRTLLITQDVHSFLDVIQEVIPDWDIIIGKDPSIWKPYVSQAEIIAGWKKEIQNVPPHLKWLQTWSAGVNSLPLSELNEKGVSVTSANGVHAFPISETIFALMLSLTRKIHTYVKQQQTKQWHHAGLNLELHGKTIGIIGVGAIGKETAKIAKAFGMKTLGVRRSGEQTEYIDHMYTLNHLNDILPNCDYVVVTLPLTNETYHLFTRVQFERMKSSAFFINIGRGALVAEEELTEALQKREIAGAGLDVFEQEPLPLESSLWELENVIVTPHTSGDTQYYDERVIHDIFLPNLKQYLQHKPLTINLLDFKKGY
ncbi:D-2-hydroxyacid dehydrogenase [Metabacillus iocasae]|uniref:Phosphoglycerate dehydrogenase-like enzyme n=1 Tax=Priestia iocasae TaxID=2291674 RepID=A0ABS2QW66_9BACI|nr:D-2-hydroxyacid dehydrogenase [Metabacillus iocasae]MBM7703723.1 phosphoglycerate dehydrogenase-like enzyme [Metabacillus iocasae]